MFTVERGTAEKRTFWRRGNGSGPVEWGDNKKRQKAGESRKRFKKEEKAAAVRAQKSRKRRKSHFRPKRHRTRVLLLLALLLFESGALPGVAVTATLD